MISHEAKLLDERNIIILESGSDVSLMPLCLGVEFDGPADGAEVQLKDCQSSALEFSRVKVASLVVEDVDGSQAELETQFVVSNSVKSCIFCLGQLYRAGWSVQQDNMGPMLESPNKTLRVPGLYQRNFHAIRGEVCRAVAADGCSSDAGIVRAVVELEEKFRLNVLRQTQWETSVDGNPFHA